jgi:hypothetical protein
LAQCSGGRWAGSLRRRTSGVGLEGPEVGDFTSAYLRMLPEVFGFTSGGFSEVAYGANCGEFSVVPNFTRRFCGVFCLLAPDIRKSANACWAYIPANLRGFRRDASGASAVLKIRILSGV